MKTGSEGSSRSDRIHGTIWTLRFVVFPAFVLKSAYPVRTMPNVFDTPVYSVCSV